MGNTITNFKILNHHIDRVLTWSPATATNNTPTRLEGDPLILLFYVDHSPEYVQGWMTRPRPVAGLLLKSDKNEFYI